MGSFELSESEGDGDEEGGGESKRGNAAGFTAKDNGGGANGGAELLAGADAKDTMNLEALTGAHIRDITASTRAANTSFPSLWKVPLLETFILAESEMALRDSGVSYELQRQETGLRKTEVGM